MGLRRIKIIELRFLNCRYAFRRICPLGDIALALNWVGVRRSPS
jgi:hypothetical protein